MKISSYPQAKEYLESFIRPILFQKITIVDGEESDPLDRFRKLLSLLNNPHKKFKAIHVSGTSGKGSTSYLISQVLILSGYKTGLSISPHLERITERMQINGREISEKDFIELVNRVSAAADEMKRLPIGEPSYFELLLAITFLYFTKEKVDIAVVEVGIEGKYDATLVIDPLVTVLTNISLDHTHILGNSVESITREAVSIIRQGVPVICGVKEKQLKKIIRQKSEDLSAYVHFLDETVQITNASSSKDGSVFSFESDSLEMKNIRLSLVGKYQIENAACVLKACEILRQKGMNISTDGVRDALGYADFSGRFEKVKLPELTHPFILDGAHNPAKLDAFLYSLEMLYPKEKKIFLVAFKKDKDTRKLLEKILPFAHLVIVTEFHQTTDLSMRAATRIEDIQNQILSLKNSDKIIFIRSSSSALDKAKELNRELDAYVIVTGSLYLVGEIRTLLKTKN